MSKRRRIDKKRTQIMQVKRGLHVVDKRGFQDAVKRTSSKLTGLQKSLVAVAIITVVPGIILGLVLGFKAFYQRWNALIETSNKKMKDHRIDPMQTNSTPTIEKTNAIKDGYRIPLRRRPPFSFYDRIDQRIATFIGDKKIRKKYEMRVLPEKQFKEGAISVTKEGKHVILQQAKQSCVPTAVAMLILDHQKTPDYMAIRATHLANDAAAAHWIEKAGLISITTKLPSARKEKVEALINLLNQNGPGALSINHPSINAHEIVLDRISLDEGTADIRDPYHGWMITIGLDTFLGLNPKTLIQVQE